MVKNGKEPSTEEMQALRCCFLGKTRMRPILLQRMFQGYQAGNCIERKGLRYLWKHVLGYPHSKYCPTCKRAAMLEAHRRSNERQKTERLENLEVQISARAVELLTLLFLDCSVIARNVPKLLFRTISEITNENTCGKIEPKRGSKKKKGEVCAGYALYAERRLIPKRVRTFVRRNAKDTKSRISKKADIKRGKQKAKE